MLLRKDHIAIVKDCPTLLWRETQRALLGDRPIPTPAEQFRMQMGQEVDQLARFLYPDGIACPGGGQSEAAAAATRECLSAAGVLFQPTFLGDRCVTRCDILRRDDMGWHLIEVKSAKGKEEVKAQYVMDVAFQATVLAENGIDLRTASLLLLNPDYVWDGGRIDPAQLFVEQDITALVQAAVSEIWTLREAALDVMQDAEIPPIVLKKSCAKCSHRVACHPELGPEHILFLPRVTQKRLSKLIEDGHERIGDLPAQIVNPGERTSWLCFSQDQGYISSELASWLDEVRFPAVFLDFEYGGPALPIIPGYACHEGHIFQWSAHILSSPEADPVHREFLHTGDGDPAETVCRDLLELLTQAESVVVYSHAERQQIQHLVKRNVPGAELLLACFEARVFDLERCIKDCVYLPGFLGQSSIKVTLPVLVPELGYSDLEIGDGQLAQTEYFRMKSATTTPGEKEAIARNLLEYCARDTYAMVALYRRLRELCSEPVF